MSLSNAEKSVLLYAETCLVDHGGLLNREKLNDADFKALESLQERGYLEYGRIPMKALPIVNQGRFLASLTHWVTFNELAWDVTHQLRRLRAEQGTPKRQLVDQALAG